jgi:hypothetical protein
VTPSMIRKGADKTSEKIGELEVGEEITAISATTVENTVRVQFERGWVSLISKTGTVLLEEVVEDGNKQLAPLEPQPEPQPEPDPADAKTNVQEVQITTAERKAKQAELDSAKAERELESEKTKCQQAESGQEKAKTAWEEAWEAAWEKRTASGEIEGKDKDKDKEREEKQLIEAANKKFEAQEEAGAKARDSGLEGSSGIVSDGTPEDRRFLQLHFRTPIEAARAKDAFDDAAKPRSKLARPGKKKDDMSTAKMSDNRWAQLWPLDDAEKILKSWQLTMGRGKYTEHPCLVYVAN